MGGGGRGSECVGGEWGGEGGGSVCVCGGGGGDSPSPVVRVFIIR